MVKTKKESVTKKTRVAKSQHVEKEEKTFGITTMQLIVIILGVLFLFTAFQVTQSIGLNAQIIQNNNLMEQIGVNPGVALSGSTQNTQTNTQSVPSSLQNVPDMVGGC